MMRTCLAQTNTSYNNKQYSQLTVKYNHPNKNNTAPSKNSSSSRRTMHPSKSKTLNDLFWLRRKTCATSKRERTHTEDTVAESQVDESQDEHDVTLESPINSSNNTSSLLFYTKKTGNSNQKSVSFCTTVSVYHHPLILGDHPAVRNGVPLMLDWTAVYIEERNLRDKSHSKTNSLVPALSLYVREVLAQQAGATKDEMCAAREQVRAIQLSRQQSMAYRRWWPFQR